MTLQDLLKELSSKTGLSFRQMENKLIVVEDPAKQTTLTVKGKVTSGADDQPLPGVNVLAKGTFNGVITNSDGSYQITVPSNTILVFSFIGFLPQEIPVLGKNSIDVTLTENITQMNEVVVTALNINRTKSSLGIFRHFHQGRQSEPGEGKQCNKYSFRESGRTADLKVCLRC